MGSICMSRHMQSVNDLQVQSMSQHAEGYDWIDRCTFCSPRGHRKGTRMYIAQNA